MAKGETTITINASVEKVFAYVNEPTNLPEVWPSMVEVKDVQRLPNGDPFNTAVARPGRDFGLYFNSTRRSILALS